MQQNFKKIDLFGPFLFLYFITLHADRLAFGCLGFNIRVNNLFAFLLLVMLICRYRSQLFSINKRFFLSLIIISCSILISLIYSPYKERCVVFFGWYGFTVLCYVILPYLLVKVWDEKKVFSLYCASFICVGLYALFQLIFSLLGFNDPNAQQRILSTIVRPNAFAGEPSFYALYMTPFICLCNFHFIASPERPFFIFKQLSLKHILFINFLFLISTSTAVFFAYALFLVLMLLCMENMRRRVMLFILGFCFIGLLATLLFPFMARNFFLKFFFSGFMPHHSFYERWIGIENAWHVFTRHPIVGVGLGGYPSFHMDAYLRGDANFAFVCTHSYIGLVQNPLKLFEAMNVFTEMLASLGVIGLCAFGFFFYQLYQQAIKHIYRDRLFTLNLLISVAVMIFVLQFSQGLFRTYIWVHLALALALLENGLENFQYYEGIAKPHLGPNSPFCNSIL